ncbi:MAG: hypothetical protein IT186_23005 [Acidobacteria bacterium]|nr:hypothetical protein [Acidobacteriota bacterium]
MPDKLDPQGHLGEISIDAFALTHRIPRDELLAVRHRVERVYNDFLGSLRSPTLADMVAAGWEPQSAVHWLLECDLEEESRRLTLWEYVTSPSSPLTRVDQLPGLCDGAIQFLQRHRPGIRSAGECEGVMSWIERRVGRAWGAGLFALREIELEGQDDPVLRPQDSSLAPDARELLVDLRLLLLNESAIALRANSPATLWGRMLHKWPSEADLAFVVLLGFPWVISGSAD